jgi:uncharacterized protein (TIGR02453 family)
MPASLYTNETLKFYRGIKRNPRKEWFEAHKDVYRESFIEPSSRFIESLGTSPEFRALGLKGSAKQGLFRIYRDVRFSHDKTPYKVHGAFVLSNTGSRKAQGFFYFHLQPGGKSGLYLGFWQLETKQLARFREWIVAHPERYLEIEARLKSRKLSFSGDDDLKRLPPAYARVADPRLHPALKRRSFGVWEELADRDITSPRLEQRVRAFVKRASPLYLWGSALLDA